MKLVGGYWGLGVILAIAVVAGWYFYDRYQIIHLNTELSENLFELAQLDVQIDRDIERVTTFRLPQYDSFVFYQRRLALLTRQLNQEIVSRKDMTAQIRKGMRQYLDKLAQKATQVEDVVSHIANIRNSLLYLPVLVEAFQTTDSPDAALQKHQFLADLYVHYLFPDRIGDQMIEQKLHHLESKESTPPVLITHATLALNEMKQVEALLKAMGELGSGMLFGNLQKALQAYRARLELRSVVVGSVLLSLVFLLLIWLWRSNLKVERARNRAQRAHDRLHDAVDSLGEAFALFNHKGRLILFNETFTRFYPWLQSHLGHDIFRDQVEKLNASHVRRLSADESQTEHEATGVERSFVEQVGTQRWLLGGDYPTSEGGWVCVRTDITQAKRAEQELQKLGRALEQSPASVVITDTRGRIEYVNPKFEDVSGYSAAEVIGKTPGILKGGDKSQQEYAAMWAALKAGKEWLGVFHNKRKDGSMYWESARISPVRDDEGQITHYIGVKEDITQRKRDQAKILYQATYDLLTGLPNRSLLTDRLTHQALLAQRKQQSFSVMFIDLDRFKVVNDLYGHVTGDELLRQVAKRFQESVRESDTVSRFGGDEFVILLSKIAKVEDASLVAEKMIRVIAAPFELGQRQVTIGASIGIARFPNDVPPATPHGEVSSILLSNADMAMYQAKEKGGNQYCIFERQMQDEMKKHLALEQDLSTALKNNELEVYYQPIYETFSNEVNGVEALLRWHHPTLGMVNPEVFVSLAEESGLIGEIGEWVFCQACDTVNRWREQYNLMFHLAVNVSARQRDRGFCAEILQRILDETGFDPRHLTLEITENLLLDESRGSAAWLKELKDVGVKLAVDDFGTGYSSLSYLKRFPVDALKIDRSFVLGLPGDKEDVSLVVAIIALADSLGIQVVAEGVETAAQRDFLKEQGCDYLQGFLFAHPMSASSIEEKFLSS